MGVPLQGEGHPAEAAPTLGRLFMMFGAAFGWIVVLTTMMPLTRDEVHSELGELYRPCILIIGTNWLLLRFPRFLFFRQFLPKPEDWGTGCVPRIYKNKRHLLCNGPL